MDLDGVENRSIIHAKWDHSEKDLEGVLEEELRTNPQVSLIIEADEDLEHGVVVKLMDIAQEAGIGSVQLEPHKSNDLD